MDEFTMKPVARKQRENQEPQKRIADTLDDIATALERIAQELQRRR